MPVRIILAEDQPVVCNGIGVFAQDAGIEIVAQLDSPINIWEAIESYRPQVLVTEVRFGGHDALKAIEEIPNGHTCQIVVFSSLDNPTNIARAGALGCHEFVLKTSPVKTLIDAILNAAKGVPTDENSILMTTKTRMRRSSKLSTDSPLTNRETQVLRHISMGLKNREIGRSLGISVETVKEHVQNILRKLDVNDRTQAAVWAIRNDYV